MSKKEQMTGEMDELQKAMEQAQSSSEQKNTTEKKPEGIPASSVMKKTPPKSRPEVVLKLDPSRCKPWKYHDRFTEWYTPERCGDLIESLLKEGQKEPVRVKELKDDPDFDFEIIVGGRRHYSSNYIKENINKEWLLEAVKVKGNVEDLVEQALVTYLENDGREAITDFERGVFFRRILGMMEGYEALFHDDGDDVEENKRLTAREKVMEKFQFKKSKFSKMVAAAELMDYDDVMRGISDRTKITYNLGHQLSALIKQSEKNRERILDAARDMYASKGKQPAGKVLRDLIASIIPRDEGIEPTEYDDDHGKQAIVFEPSKDGSAVIRLRKNAVGMDRKKLESHLLEILEMFAESV